MRLLTELLLIAGVIAPPGLVAARFTGVTIPSFIGTDLVLGFSTAALLAAFILASYISPAHAARTGRHTRARKASIMKPASEAFTVTTARRRHSPTNAHPIRSRAVPFRQNRAAPLQDPQL